ncbi:MAG: type IV pilin N-terminal domain-containing protein [Methanoregula sp.]|uniref:type IV pilin N-terminal domain-containing protein n=1 Tax=Methanoregula sp. TaxID=2052170 RepID=UPI003BB0095E
MMTPIEKNTDSAVSPVVGVMLMLVVTIIIAAVVSAFAGGLATGTSKTPQVTLSATYSQSGGMIISHNGGDNVNTMTTHFIVTPSTDFGNYQQNTWIVNSSVINVATNAGLMPWNSPNSYATSVAKTFQPGETAYISMLNLPQVQPSTYDTGLYSSYGAVNYATTDPSGLPTDAYDPNFGFLYNSVSQSAWSPLPDASAPTSYPLGQKFTLKLVDNGGRTIATTDVTIQP